MHLIYMKKTYLSEINLKIINESSEKKLIPLKKASVKYFLVKR